MSSQIGMPSRTPRKLTGPGDLGAGLEDALLVELAVVRQVDLVALGDDLAAIGDDDRIVGAAVALQRRADDDARPAIGGVGGEVLDGPLAGRQEGRLQHEVLRRIAGDEKFGEQDQVGALAGGIRPRLARLGEIAGDVADDRVQLGDGDAQHVGRGLAVHGERFSPQRFNRQCRLLGPLFAHVFAQRLGRAVLADRQREDARQMRVRQAGFLAPGVELHLDARQVALRLSASRRCRARRRAAPPPCRRQIMKVSQPSQRRKYWPVLPPSRLPCLPR